MRYMRLYSRQFTAATEHRLPVLTGKVVLQQIVILTYVNQQRHRPIKYPKPSFLHGSRQTLETIGDVEIRLDQQQAFPAHHPTVAKVRNPDKGPWSSIRLEQ